MDSKIRKTIKPLFISLVASFFITQVSAMETVSVSSGGKSMFDLVFLDGGESDAGYSATGTLSANQKRVVQAAAQLWADILAPATTNTSAAKIRVVGRDGETSALYKNWTFTPFLGTDKVTVLQVIFYKIMGVITPVL